MNWNVEVIFVDDYESRFSENEQKERKHSENRFALAIKIVLVETNVVPVVGDWIEPLAKADYPLDMGRVAGRDFYPERKTILYEIA